MHSAYSENGEYVVLDIGNKLVHRFDTKGKLITSFGKEGTGPGELNRPREVYAVPNRILVSDGRTLHIYKTDGSFLKDVSEQFARPQVSKDGIYFYFFSSPQVRFISKKYNFDGKIVAEVKNPQFSKEQAEQGFQFNSDRLKTMMLRPRDLTPYGSMFIQYHPGTYQIEILDENQTSKYMLTRNFVRKKELAEEISRMQARFSNRGNRRGGNSDRIKQMFAAREDITGGYQNDILGILGVFNEFAFIETAKESLNEMNIDVISKDNQYIAKFKVDGDEILSASVNGSKLLVNMKNEEDGPYVKVFDIKLK